MNAKRGQYYKYQMLAAYIAQVLIRHFMCFLNERSAVLYFIAWPVFRYVFEPIYEFGHLQKTVKVSVLV